jgi:PAS domain S-box-containing protein
MEEKTKLRTRAEAELLKRPLPELEISESEIKKLIHELQVHQIQLEMQNDELRKIQLSLQESHDRYTHLYDFAPVGYMTLDSEGKIVEINLTCTQMLGIARVNLLNKKFNSFIDRKSQDTFYFHFNNLLDSNEESNSCEIKIKKLSKDSFWVQLNSNRVNKEYDNSFQIKISLTNIEELKKTQREKIEAHQLIAKEEKHTAMGKIAGKIAHDFNNILAIIMGNAELGAFNCHDNKIKQKFETIYEQAVRGSDLTKELIIFSKEPQTKNKYEVIKNINDCYNKNILIVEDEINISDIQKMALTDDPFNHRVDVAKDGNAALKLLNIIKYDLITLDYILPGQFNGMHIYEHIRQKDKDVPILFISGNIEFIESIKTLKENDNKIDHLSKPHGIKEYIV